MNPYLIVMAVAALVTVVAWRFVSITPPVFYAIMAATVIFVGIANRSQFEFENEWLQVVWFCVLGGIAVTITVWITEVCGLFIFGGPFLIPMGYGR